MNLGTAKACSARPRKEIARSKSQNHNWIAKIEYLYFDLGTVTTIPAPTPGTTTAVAFNSRITDNILRVGVNYKFDPNELWVDY